jgi:hypothetical protein
MAIESHGAAQKKHGKPLTIPNSLQSKPSVLTARPDIYRTGIKRFLEANAAFTWPDIIYYEICEDVNAIQKNLTPFR